MVAESSSSVPRPCWSTAAETEPPTTLTDTRTPSQGTFDRAEHETGSVRGPELELQATGPSESAGEMVALTTEAARHGLRHIDALAASRVRPAVHRLAETARNASLF